MTTKDLKKIASCVVAGPRNFFRRSYSTPSEIASPRLASHRFSSGPTRQGGFMLAEMLVYVFTAVLVLAAITYFTVQLYGAYTALIAPARADRVGLALMHEIAKEIRSGTSVNQGATAFGVPAGFITINARQNNTDVVKYFALENGRVVYEENGGASVFRTPEDMSISTFRFTQVSTPVSYAIRYEVSVTYEVRGGEQTRSFTGLAVMRHSYE